MTLRQIGYFGLYVWARADAVTDTVAIVKIARARMRFGTSLISSMSAHEDRPRIDHSQGAGLSIAIKSSTSMRGRTTAYWSSLTRTSGTSARVL